MYRFSFIYTFPIENLHDPVTWLCRRPGNSCRFRLNRLFSKTGSEMLAQPSNTVKRFLVVLTFNQAVRFSLDGSAVKIHVQAVRAAADTDSADDQGTLTALINAATRSTTLPIDRCRSAKAVCCRVRQTAVRRFTVSAHPKRLFWGGRRRPSDSECAIHLYL